jgi:hypothetical protein
MRRFLLVALFAAILPFVTGCACCGFGGRDRAAGDEAAAGGPRENYDRGDWSQDPVPVMMGRWAVGVVAESPNLVLHDPFWAWGQAWERDGYPYAGIRTGCNLLYWPTINACKYFNHPERITRLDRVAETDAQLFVDDWDMFWLNDRPTYLTRWYVR